MLHIFLLLASILLCSADDSVTEKYVYDPAFGYIGTTPKFVIKQSGRINHGGVGHRGLPSPAFDIVHHQQTLVARDVYGRRADADYDDGGRLATKYDPKFAIHNARRLPVFPERQRPAPQPVPGVLARPAPQPDPGVLARPAPHFHPREIAQPDPQPHPRVINRVSYPRAVKQVAILNHQPPAEIQEYGHPTKAPTFFTTVRHGPRSTGHLKGAGRKSATDVQSRDGHAEGSLYARDGADAKEAAAKTRGYQYNYRSVLFSQQHNSSRKLTYESFFIDFV